MITSKFTFNFDGSRHKLTAILTNDFELSSSRKNEATDITEDEDPELWSLYFPEFAPGYNVEIQLKRDSDGEKTFEAETAVIWYADSRDGIAGYADVQVSVKHS